MTDALPIVAVFCVVTVTFMMIDLIDYLHKKNV